MFLNTDFLREAFAKQSTVSQEKGVISNSALTNNQLKKAVYSLNKKIHNNLVKQNYKMPSLDYDFQNQSIMVKVNVPDNQFNHTKNYLKNTVRTLKKGQISFQKSIEINIYNSEGKKIN